MYNNITEPAPTNTFSQRAQHFSHSFKHVTTQLKAKHIKQLAEPSYAFDYPFDHPVPDYQSRRAFDY